MRVIAGMHRGRTLQAPKGNDTRPTTDRVRESLFSSLNSLCGGFEDAIVLDAFAGSGALGIEALSRGAAYACFCEKNRNALQALERNTSFLPASSYAIMRNDVFKTLPRSQQPFTLVFFDPPYACNPAQLCALLEKLAGAQLLDEDVIVSYEYSAQAEEDALLSCNIGLQLVSSKNYGNTSISFYRRG